MTGGRTPALRVAAEKPGALSRRVVVKASVVKMSGRGVKAAALHLRYIERDGVEKDGSKGVLYGAEGPVRAAAFEESRPDEKHQFRLIVSPEDAGELDLTAYVRRLMAQVEKDVGLRLDWAAVNHFDTDHPHAHVVVRGVDREGREVRLDRAYVSHGLRRRAQELATDELGPRTELDAKHVQAKEVTQERFTSLDRELERRLEANVVTLGTRGQSTPGTLNEVTLAARMAHLEELRLAARVSPTSWVMADGWASQLREMGNRGDILKQMHAALRGDPARYRVVAAGQAVEPVPSDLPGLLHGRIARKGLSDELRGTYYAVIETPDGGGYHVPLDKAAAEVLREGDLVTFSSKPSSGDEGARHRLVVRKDALRLEEQVHHAGPVPLDRLARRSCAPYGFGAEVGEALERRANALRRLGIDPADPARLRALRELERRAVGERIAARSGLPFVAETPATFQGRIQHSERAPDGTAYLVVSDGARIMVVAAGRQGKLRDGQSVLVSRGVSGDWRVRPRDKDLER